MTPSNAPRPPWEVYPHIPFLDIGWRMGPGETYWVKFSDFYNALSEGEKAQYERENPEPEAWSGFYALKRQYP